MAENKTNRDAASIGIIRSAEKLDKPNTVVTVANQILKDESLDPSVLEESKYFRSKAFLKLGEKTQAEKDLSDLSKDTRTVFGAEAKYLLGQIYFDTNRAEKAKEVVNTYIKQGTPHAYWLARSFILMSDIYAAEGDKLQARQYLESLQNNYTHTNDDIQSMINNRLEKL
jgi:TolA-binding protein